MGFEVRFDSDLCKGCGLCLKFCPKKLLAFDTSCYNAVGVHPAHVKAEEECIGCLSCALMCPDAVISISKNANERG